MKNESEGIGITRQKVEKNYIQLNIRFFFFFFYIRKGQAMAGMNGLWFSGLVASLHTLLPLVMRQVSNTVCKSQLKEITNERDIDFYI